MGVPYRRAMSPDGATVPGTLMRTRVALIGDVGGHLDTFASALRQLGVDTDQGHVPADLLVVQVGDLVHRGPDSTGCVHLADRLLNCNEGRYVQLLGNHEAFYLGGPRFVVRDDLSTDADHTVQRWWLDQRARLGLALDTVEHGEVLVTHAGLTSVLWDRLGSPSAAESADLLNQWVGTRPELAFAPGRRLSGHIGAPGPVWADPTGEVYPSWIGDTRSPFGQVHGHLAAWDWEADRWQLDTPPEVRRLAADIDPSARHTTVHIGGRPFIGIDPDHGSKPARDWQPLLLTLRSQRRVSRDRADGRQRRR